MQMFQLSELCNKDHYSETNNTSHRVVSECSVEKRAPFTEVQDGRQ